MSKHEIRLRRQKLSGRSAERFRNYGAILKRHEQDKRLKRILTVLTYFLIIVILTLFILIAMRVDWKAPKKEVGQATITTVKGY